MQDLRGQHRVLAVLDELAQVGQARLLALRVLLDDADDAVHDGPFVLETTLWGEDASSLPAANTTISAVITAFSLYMDEDSSDEATPQNKV